MKIAVIGPKELIIPFKAIGIDTFSSKKKENEEILKTVISKGYKLILITEDVLSSINYNDYIYLQDVNILPIPGPHLEKTGIGRSIVKELIRKAVGVDVGGIND